MNLVIWMLWLDINCLMDKIHVGVRYGMWTVDFSSNLVGSLASSWEACAWSKSSCPKLCVKSIWSFQYRTLFVGPSDLDLPLILDRDEWRLVFYSKNPIAEPFLVEEFLTGLVGIPLHRLLELEENIALLGNTRFDETLARRRMLGEVTSPFSHHT